MEIQELDRRDSASAATVNVQFVEVAGRRLAYRSVGQGKPMVLCNRFRGVMDLWDPAFIDALAAHGFQVVTFDYSGLGHSTGERTYHPAALAKDARDLIEALRLDNVVLGGWSLGGIVAQIGLAMFGARVSHLVLIATTPPGPLVKPGEQLFYDTAGQPGASLDQFTTLFFEPSDARSTAASQASYARIFARETDRSQEVPVEWAASQLGGAPRNPMFPSEEVLALLKSTSKPILHLGADHDIAFPVENWYALNRQLPSLHLVTFPRSGHAPHHQHPALAALHIAAFVKGLAG